VYSRVQNELDDIDRALSQLGHLVTSSQSLAPVVKKRREKVDDAQIIASLRTFMKPGETYSSAEILKASNLKAARFANFKSKNKHFLKTHGAKRSMRYSLNA